MKNRVPSLARNTSTLLFALTLSLGWASQSFAQTVSDFTMDRYSTAGENMFETFYVEDTQSLQDALNSDIVAGETMLLVTETAAGKLALIRDQMSFHHIVQGRAAGKNWMATF